MARRRNNPNNQFVKKANPQEPQDSQPWNRSRVEVEPMPAEPETQVTAPESRGRYNDRIKVAPMDEQGRATDRALKGWPEGIKKA